MTVKQDRYGNIVQAARPYLTQVVTVGATANSSAPFSVLQQTDGQPTYYADDGTAGFTPQLTLHIRLVSTVACWVTFGNPPPTTVKQVSPAMFMPANLPEYFWVRPGEQVRAIQDVGGGFLYITELAND